MASMIDHRDAHYVKTLNDVTDHRGVCVWGGGGEIQTGGGVGDGQEIYACACQPIMCSIFWPFSAESGLPHSPVCTWTPINPINAVIYLCRVSARGSGSPPPHSAPQRGYPPLIGKKKYSTVISVKLGHFKH